VTCSICARAIDAPSIAAGGVHPECLASGLLRDTTLAVAELIAIVAAPLIVVWTG
jgi:hypothetical protein